MDCEDGRSQENLYDAEGLRYGVKEDDVFTRFVYHRGELLQEEREGGRNSYYLRSGIEAAQMGGELYYYHQDEQLSTALLSDHVGKVRNHYRYSAFGEILEGSESVGNGSGIRASSMMGSVINITCGRDIITQWWGGSCRRMCIRRMG